ncbi:GHKL domain-containing protein [Pontibacter diazotrophicus]|uniref:histidine kinase n=1 Tax=Pontibacter diazotrophicus TaxID=1400979 RepID=A0A3D8LF00_9BACT|nr:ATP-binding protein [Pontibacter diazotrophicus]RDV15995.1 GHKL domain-containing protein [Pontibacter diazotrophicus]
MVFNGFKAKLLFRLLLLVAIIVLTVFVLYRTDWYMTAFCLFLLVLFQLYDMLYFVERTNRDISSFLEAIKHSDFTQRFAAEGANSSFRDLYSSFNEISESFQRVKTEKQAHYHYLQTIIEQVGTGILTFNEEGEVQLVNHVVKELLRVPHLRNIHALERLSPELVYALWHTKHNEKSLITVTQEQDQLLLNVHVTELYSRGQLLRIVTLQNIQSELEEQELQTWQKVIRVLTHEIMNSVTPVISLTSTVAGLLESEVIAKQAAGEPIEEEVLEDMQAGLQTIERRSAGMLHFVKDYRRLMRLPVSELRPVKVRELLQNVRRLLQPDMQTQHISLKLYLPEENLAIQADAEQLEQVLINLIKNGMEACEAAEKPCVEVLAYIPEQEKNRVRIDVTDNGAGIPEDVRDKIFIPFYTTKKQGSGIGLSLSKQIIRQHGGSIRVNSQPGGPTVFSLQLKAITE